METPRIFDLGIAGRRLAIDECRIIADHEATTAIARFRHSRLTDSQELQLLIEGNVEGAEWLKASLRSSSGKDAMAVPLRSGEHVDLVIDCEAAPDKSRIRHVSSDEFGLSLSLTLVRFGPQARFGAQTGAQQSSETRSVDVSRVVLTTTHHPRPVVEPKFPTVPVLSRADRGKERRRIVGQFNVRQPATDLEYGGPQVTFGLAVKGRGEAADGSTTELALDLERTGIDWKASDRNNQKDDITLDPGNELSFDCTVDVEALFALAAQRDLISIDLDWTYWTSEKGQLPRDKDFAGGQQAVTVGFARGEILELVWHELSIVPPISKDEPTALVPFGRERNFRLSDRDPSFRVKMLDETWDQLSVEALVTESQAALDAEARGLEVLPPTRLNDNPTFDVPLAEMVKEAGLARVGATMALRLRLAVGRSGEEALGFVEAPLRFEGEDPSLVACLDVGASATTLWFSEADPLGKNGKLPIGDFVSKIAGPHDEFDPSMPGENYLLPMIVGLNSELHMRSCSDPLSLGRIEEVGSSEDAVLRRLIRMDRSYDISLPFMPLHRIEEMRRQVVTDLKRRLLAKRPIDVAALERKDGALMHNDLVDPARLMLDVFDEVGSYLAPQSLWYSTVHSKNPQDQLQLYEMWLDADPSEIQVVVAHPSDIDEHGRKLYAEAASRFAARFTSGTPGVNVREPKLVPEALAAAYFGIEKTRGDLAGEHVYACLDIGSSTFDASLIKVNLSRDSDISWNVLAHFGGAVGGADLDEALLDLVLNAIKEHFHRDSSERTDYTLAPEYAAGGGALRHVVSRRIQLAKKQLTQVLLEEAKRTGAYDWSASGPGSGLVVSMRGVLVRQEAGRKSQALVQALDQDEGVWLEVVEIDPEQHEIQIRISPHLLDARPEDSQKRHSRFDPRSVARLLGTALPTMLARECERLKQPPPKWVMTGRTCLWPAVYSEVGRTVAAMDKGQLAQAVPFKPEEMKNAIVVGARALSNGRLLELTDGSLKPFAIVRYKSLLEPHETNPIAEIDYIDFKGEAKGRFETEYRTNSEVCRVLPGLTDPEQSLPISRDEIVSLFQLFGLRIKETVQSISTSDIPPYATASKQQVSISWQLVGRDVFLQVGG